MIARQRKWLMIASTIGFMCVVFGAFAAHALKGALTEAAQHQFELGVRYAFIHAMAMIATAFSQPFAGRPEHLESAARLFLLGIVLFSGSLLLLAITGVKYFAYFTPLGGLAFLAAWLYLGLSMRAKQ